MARLYKLTEEDWSEGAILKPRKDFHVDLDPMYAYRSSDLAYLLDPGRGYIQNPKVWEVEAEGEVVDNDFLSDRYASLTTIREVEKPSWVGGEKDLFIRVAFAALCAEAALPLFEDKFPEEGRVREAIRAAKACLDSPTLETAAAAKKAAEAAADIALTLTPPVKAKKAAKAAAWSVAHAAWTAAAAVSDAVKVAAAAAAGPWTFAANGPWKAEIVEPWTPVEAAAAAVDEAAVEATWTVAEMEAEMAARPMKATKQDAAEAAAQAAEAAAEARVEIDFQLLAEKAVEAIIHT